MKWVLGRWSFVRRLVAGEERRRVLGVWMGEDGGFSGVLGSVLCDPSVCRGRGVVNFDRGLWVWWF